MKKLVYEEVKNCLLKEYSDERYKKVLILDIYFKDKKYFDKVCNQDKIKQFMEKYKEKFRVIYNTIEVPFFRSLKYDEVLKEMYGNKEKNLFQENEEQQQLIAEEKLRKEVFQNLLRKTQNGEITWSAKLISKNKWRYDVEQRQPQYTYLIVNLKAKDNEEKYSLVIYNKIYNNQKNGMLLEEAIQENKKKYRIPKNHKMYQIHHSKEEFEQQAIEKRKRKEKKKVEKNLKNIKQR